jgi:hypothetical protein
VQEPNLLLLYRHEMVVTLIWYPTEIKVFGLKSIRRTVIGGMV